MEANKGSAEKEDFTLMLFAKNLAEHFYFAIETLGESGVLISAKYKGIDLNKEFDKIAMLEVIKIKNLLQYIETVGAYCLACQKDNSKDFINTLLQYKPREVTDFFLKIEELSNEQLNNILSFVDSSYWKPENDITIFEEKMQKSRVKLRENLLQLRDIWILYLFSWDNVPGNDSKSLLRFLRDDLIIGWAENAKIQKSDDGKTICIFKDKNSAKIMIEEGNKKAILKINDDRPRELKVKKKNDKLNIYWTPFYDFYNASKHGGRWWMHECRESGERSVGIQWLNKYGSMDTYLEKIEDLNLKILKTAKICKDIMAAIYHNQELIWPNNPPIDPNKYIYIE